MAEKEESKTKETKSNAVQSDSIYSKREILAAAASFGVSVDAMAGALRLVEKEQLTRSEVEKVIQDFKKRQVK